MQTRCPICKTPARPRPENRAWPFCSPRCRMVDLGRWLGEEYRVPGPLDPEALERLGEGEAGGDEAIPRRGRRTDYEA